ncbi:MAG: shikimate dehydrogenase [Pseudomonadota bacterium]|nr:shikimate dehydrogenase [Pseudomonadota bacterium]MEC8087852.1 shikimate dehydrogenase [Pseudomonadota bacterium]MEC8530972.1 shikimate dehydrogenase [Pseudomonadota bacterium]MEC8725336.1 shikimate dehydrogenase [Pseudomonadota bacterium]
MTFTGGAVVAGVAGWPINHSKSPQIHNFWLRKHEIDGVYAPFAVHPERAYDAFRSIPLLGLAGMNVTLPHKEIAYTAMDKVDHMAQRLKAVNTIVVRRGKLHGANTDFFGFFESLREACPSWHANTGPAVVLGAGGAARAIVAGLQDAGAPEIFVINRTPQRVEALADEFGPPIRPVPWESRAVALSNANLLVNATSLGMRGQPPLDLPLYALPQFAVVYDIVYVPLETPLLAAARARGNVAVDGLGMLLHQARQGFRDWFGPDPEVNDALRAYVLEAL